MTESELVDGILDYLYENRQFYVSLRQIQNQFTDENPDLITDALTSLVKQDQFIKHTISAKGNNLYKFYAYHLFLKVNSVQKQKVRLPKLIKTILYESGEMSKYQLNKLFNYHEDLVNPILESLVASGEVTTRNNTVSCTTLYKSVGEYSYKDLYKISPPAPLVEVEAAPEPIVEECDPIEVQVKMKRKYTRKISAPAISEVSDHYELFNNISYARLVYSQIEFIPDVQSAPQPDSQVIKIQNKKKCKSVTIDVLFDKITDVLKTSDKPLSRNQIRLEIVNELGCINPNRLNNIIHLMYEQKKIKYTGNYSTKKLCELV